MADYYPTLSAADLKEDSVDTNIDHSDCANKEANFNEAKGDSTGDNAAVDVSEELEEGNYETDCNEARGDSRGDNAADDVSEELEESNYETDGNEARGDSTGDNAADDVSGELEEGSYETKSDSSDGYAAVAVYERVKGGSCSDSGGDNIGGSFDCADEELEHKADIENEVVSTSQKRGRTAGAMNILDGLSIYPSLGRVSRRVLNFHTKVTDSCTEVFKSSKKRWKGAKKGVRSFRGSIYGAEYIHYFIVNAILGLQALLAAGLASQTTMEMWGFTAVACFTTKDPPEAVVAVSALCGNRSKGMAYAAEGVSLAVLVGTCIYAITQYRDKFKPETEESLQESVKLLQDSLKKDDAEALHAEERGEASLYVEEELKDIYQNISVLRKPVTRYHLIGIFLFSCALEMIIVLTYAFIGWREKFACHLDPLRYTCYTSPQFGYSVASALIITILSFILCCILCWSTSWMFAAHSMHSSMIVDGHNRF